MNIRTAAIRLWAPLIVYMCVMWYCSSQPKEKFPSVKIPYADKIAHVVEYGIFGYLLTRALYPDADRATVLRRLFIVAVVSALWGASDEIHQYFVPTRDMDAVDWLSDCAGAGIGYFFYETCYR
ncbi:MAG: VanZ family protein [Candidatus Omnitrophica bacterium]|nr:VanZ family protein [Candidatus Omnitrophota bacterium]